MGWIERKMCIKNGGSRGTVERRLENLRCHCGMLVLLLCGDDWPLASFARQWLMSGIVKD